MTDCRRVCLTTVIAALPLIVAMFGPAKARATCGDYVVVGNANQGAKDHSNHLPAEKPCHGPMCSNHQPPMTPATPVAPNHIDEQFVGTSFLRLPRATFTSRIDSLAEIPLRSSPSDVFHPPRSAASL